jgi:hypothetical protein
VPPAHVFDGLLHRGEPRLVVRRDVVTKAAEEYGMTMVHTGLRLILH